MARRAGRSWRGRRAGITLMLLVAALPVEVFYSREARPYATGQLALFAFLDAVALRVRRRGWLRTAYLLAAATLSVLWQYACLPVVLAGLVAGFAWDRARPRRGPRGATVWPMALAPMLILGVAVLIGFQLPQMRRHGTFNAFLQPHYYRLSDPRGAVVFVITKPAELLTYLVLGETGDRRMKIVCLLAWLPLLYGAVVLPRGQGRGRAIVLLGLLPVAFFVMAAGFRLHPFGGIRHCLSLAPGLLLLYASGLHAARRRWGPISELGLLALVVLAIRADLVEIPEWYVHEIGAVVAAAEQQSQPGDGAIFTPAVGSPHRYETRHAPDRFGPTLYLDELTRSRGSVERNRAASSANLDRTITEHFVGTNRVWLFSTGRDAGRFEAILVEQGRRPAARIARRGASASLWIVDPSR